MKHRKKSCELPIMPAQCATCPFRKGVAEKYARLTGVIGISALTEANRICHSTGSNALHRRTGKPETLCRGARDLQLQFFHVTGIISAPTDEAWEAKCIELGLKSKP